MLTTPVLFCVFNRPKLTQQVFDALRQAKPQTLLVVADGPRDSHPEDRKLVQETQEIVSRIDWPCDVHTNYSDTNMGCRLRMASGLRWAFDRFEELIVLEDDCLPGPAFFDFCTQMLDRYRNQTEIGMICGDQFLERLSVTTDAYFSKYPFVWGWASWRRAWQHYDLKMARWPQRADTSWLEQWTVDAAEHLYWKGIFQRQHDGEIDTWDYSWIFNCWDQDLLSIHPTTNLVSNIGFGSDATHTTDQSSRLANLPSDTSQQHREWTLPAKISLDPSIESRIFHEVYCPPAPVAQPHAKSRQKKWTRLRNWLAGTRR